jgi:hypothetical protein
MHHTLFLRARAFVFEDQPLALIFARRQSRLPEPLVVIELHFQRWQVAKDVFCVLRDGAAFTFQGPGHSPVVWLRTSWNGRGLSSRNRS